MYSKILVPLDGSNFSEPAGAIIDLARKTSNSLIAMSTHGRSGTGRWILGSVAERIIQHSQDPVLLIRAA